MTHRNDRRPEEPGEMKSYGEYLQGIFPGIKVQKISLNAGFGCPNRDGSKGTGGCSYCRVDSFTPGYCMTAEPVAEQLRKGKEFFGRKYPEMKYLAYFQSYTNTHSSSQEALRTLYMEALAVPGVVGLVIGTRPDCLPDGVLDMLGELAHRVPVFLEIGAETSHDSTLAAINRNHTWGDVEDAVMRAKTHGLHVGLHLIAGLPGEDAAMVLETVDRACALGPETLKMHQLQILVGTPLHDRWLENPDYVRPLDLDEYTALCVEILRRVPPTIVMERFLSQSPPQLVAAPKWGLKNYQFMDRIRAMSRH